MVRLTVMDEEAERTVFIHPDRVMAVWETDEEETMVKVAEPDGRVQKLLVRESVPLVVQRVRRARQGVGY
jgi:hypothetical protein